MKRNGIVGVGKKRERDEEGGYELVYGGDDGKLHTKAPRYVRRIKFADQSSLPSRLQFLSLAIPAVDLTGNCPEEYLPTNLISTPACRTRTLTCISSHHTRKSLLLLSILLTLRNRALITVTVQEAK